MLFGSREAIIFVQIVCCCLRYMVDDERSLENKGTSVAIAYYVDYGPTQQFGSSLDVCVEQEQKRILEQDVAVEKINGAVVFQSFPQPTIASPDGTFHY